MIQSTRDRAAFTDAITKRWPEIVKDGTFGTLLKTKGIVFYGPFVLFAFLNITDKRLPIHIQVPLIALQNVKSLLLKHTTTIQEAIDSHMHHHAHYQMLSSANGVVVILSSDNTIMGFADVYNVTFDSTDGFQGTVQQQKSVQSKIVHLNAHVAKKLLLTISHVERFMDVDCSLLHKAGFRIDWNSQEWWRMVWKLALHQENWIFAFREWNRVAIENKSLGMTPRPILAIYARKPLFYDDSFRVANCLFGCAMLSVDTRNKDILTALPFVQWNALGQTVIVTTQIGELLPKDTQEQYGLLVDDKQLLLENLVTITGYTTEQKQKEERMTYGRKDIKSLAKMLQSDKRQIIVFIEDPETHELRASLFSIDASTTHKYYTCDGTIINTQKNYWELNVLDSRNQPILIQQRTLHLVQQRSTVYFKLIIIRDNVNVVDASTVDEHKQSMCQPPRSVFDLIPIKVNDQNPIFALQHIFDRMVPHPKRKQSRRREPDPDETDTETAESSSNMNSEDDENDIINQQHQAEDD